MPAYSTWFTLDLRRRMWKLDLYLEDAAIWRVCARGEIVACAYRGHGDNAESPDAQAQKCLSLSSGRVSPPVGTHQARHEISLADLGHLKGEHKQRPPWTPTTTGTSFSTTTLSFATPKAPPGHLKTLSSLNWSSQQLLCQSSLSSTVKMTTRRLLVAARQWL